MFIPNKPSHLTLPLKNGSLAEGFNSDKENANDENLKGAIRSNSSKRQSGWWTTAKASQTLCAVDQTLFTRVKTHKQRQLTGA